MNLLGTPMTTFMTNTCNYYYKVILFCLKKVSVTYQISLDVVLAKRIWKNFGVYIDGMIVKMSHQKNHCEDFEEILRSVSRYNKSLNPD